LAKKAEFNLAFFQKQKMPKVFEKKPKIIYLASKKQTGNTAKNSEQCWHW